MSSNVDLVEIVKSFGDQVAVDRISFTVPSGTFFSLLGPSGCGKTTTLRIISGFEHADSGELHIGGKDVSRDPPYKRPTNMVFQRWALFPHMTVRANVAFGLEVERLPRNEIDGRVAEAVDLVGLSEYTARKPAQLSGGQMQRVALARALIKRPEVLLLDEPLGALDLKLRHQMQLELKRIQHEVGTTFIYVTHDQGEAVTMSDQIAVMNQGRIEQIGSPREIYDLPRTRFVAGFIGNTNLLPATIKEWNRERAVVSVGNVTFPCLVAPDARPDAAIVSIRYERVKVGDAASSCATRTKAQVRDAIFSGSVVQYVLGLSDTPIELVAETTHDSESSLIENGTIVDVGWDVDSARLFSDDG